MIELKLSTYRNESMNNHLSSDEMKIIILKIDVLLKENKIIFLQKNEDKQKKTF